MSFKISNLFSDNTDGFWHDFSDISTFFQDVEGTVPVTKVGQPIRLILDKSGNDNHFIVDNSVVLHAYGNCGKFGCIEHVI
jgi:hypothetical protein